MLRVCCNGGGRSKINSLANRVNVQAGSSASSWINSTFNLPVAGVVFFRSTLQRRKNSCIISSHTTCVGVDIFYKYIFYILDGIKKSFVI